MRRREVLAGAASLGVLGGAGAAAVYGLPGRSGEGERRHEPIAVQTLAATGSEAGELSVPVEGRVTFVEFFATTCTVCRSEMPDLREAHDRVGEDVAFVSVTNESESVADDGELAAWWEEYDGAWTLARDATSDLVVHYGAGTPIGVVFDADGRVRWEERGAKTADEIVAQIDRARDGGFL